MSEIHGATGSYAVNALDPDEFDEFEAHLAVCPTCRHEIVEFCETAAQLSLLADAPPPPLSLRDSVLAGIAEVRPLPPLESTPRRAFVGTQGLRTEEPEAVSSPAPTLRAVGPAAPPRPVAPPVAAAAVDPVADELALRREHRRSRLLTLLVAAVTVVALALGGTVFSLVQNRQQVPVAGAEADPSLLGAADAKIVKTTLPNGAQVSFVVSKSQNRALFVSGDLPSPGAGKTYQLWTLKNKVATPDNLVGGGANQQQWFHGPINTSNGLAVTIEPEQGSKQPTGTPTSVSI